MRNLLFVLGLVAPLVSLGLAAPARADIPGPSTSSAGGGGAGGGGGSGGSAGGSSEDPKEEDTGCSIVAPGKVTYGAAGAWILGLGALLYSRRFRRAG